MKKRKCLFAIVCALALLLSACTAEKPPETSAPIETKPPVETTASVETTQPQIQIPDGAYPAGTYEIGTQLMERTYVLIPYDPAQTASVRVERNTETVLKQSFTGRFFWTPKEGDTLTVEDGYFLPAEGYTVPKNADGSYSPGMYRIGIDIPEGDYRVIPQDGSKAKVWRFTSITEKGFSSEIVTKEKVFSTEGYAALYLENGSMSIFDFDSEDTPFSLPAAPEATEVKALPDSYDAAALVSPCWEQGAAFGNVYSFYISIPEIYPFSEDAIAAQQEIYELFYDELEWLEEYSVNNPVTKTLDMSEVTIFSDFGGDPTAYYGYSAGIRDGILSIIVRNDWLYNSAGRSFYTYNFDLTTGKRLDSQAMHDRLGVSQDAITQGVTEFYEEKHAALPDKTVDFYQENLKKTLSEENLSAGQLCIGEDGAVMMAVEIYSIGSLEHVQRLVKIAD